MQNESQDFGLHSAFCIHHSAFGFTLTELLVVISIIVLMLGLAVPALKILGGGRSIESAENQIGAILGRARAQAISDRTIAGAMFYLDPKDSRVRAVIVEQAGGVTSPIGGAVVLDLATDVLPQAGTPLSVSNGVTNYGNPAADIFLLPPSVGIQFLDGCYVDTTVNPPVRWDDGYVGFNTRNQWSTAVTPPRTFSSTTPLGVKYGGVILFDGTGKLVADTFVFDAIEPDPVTPANSDFTPLGQILFGAGQYDKPSGGSFTSVTLANSQFVSPTPPDDPRSSQYGLVVFDGDAFRAKGYTDEDAEVEAPIPTAAGTPQSTIQAVIKSYYQSAWPSPSSSGGSWQTGAPAETTEETWLDQNATPLMINRFNGTLIRGE